MRALCLIAILLSLTGCSLFESRAERAERNSPDYKAGYSDGCASASAQGASPRGNSLVRDDEAYRSNPAYHAGWGTGFNGCRLFQNPAGPGLPGSGPILGPH